MNNLPTFASSVEEAKKLLLQLDEILLREREAIRQREPSDIHQLLQEKTNLLQQLEHNGIERIRMLKEAGFEASDQGVQDYLQQQTPNEALQLGIEWDGLKVSLESCRTANIVNGNIIHRSRQQINLLLDMMRGQSNTPRLYTQTGSNTKAQRQLPLAEA